MIFRRKPPPPVDLTNDAYGRWLRAGRPQPIAWFLGVHPEEQEQLAIMGDEYQQDVCVAIGYAVADPQLADAGLDAAENPDSEEVLIRRMAADVASKLLDKNHGHTKPEAPVMSMSGVSQRRKAAEAAAAAETKDAKAAKSKARSFLGRAPDSNGGAPSTPGS